MTLLTYLKLNTSDLDAGVAKAKTEIAGLNAAASGAGNAAPGMGKLTDGLNQVQPAASKAVMGVNAVTAASGLMSGSVTGVASGTMALSNALKGLGVASGGTVALVVALAAAITMLVMAMADAKAKSARLVDSIQLGNAQGGVDSLRKGFERLVDTMDGAVGLMRELRALTQEGVDIDADKRIAQLDLDRKRELSGLKPGDEKGEREINSRYDRLGTGAELDKEQGANTAAAAEQRKQREENAAAIAERRAQVVALTDKAGAAATKATEFGNDSAGVNSVFGKKQIEHNEKMATEWGATAQKATDEAQRIRKEIEELERKNQVLEEQAKIYEKRNEVVAIKREAAGIADPAKAEKEEKGISGGSSAMNIPTDRLTRIGGVTAGGFGASFGGGVAEKQLAEARLTRQLLERIARKEPGGAVLG